MKSLKKGRMGRGVSQTVSQEWDYVHSIFSGISPFPGIVGKDIPRYTVVINILKLPVLTHRVIHENQPSLQPSSLH